MMTKMEELYIKKYVIPFQRLPDRRKEVMNELINEENSLEIIKLLLTCKGWRERRFASMAIGIFQLEQFIDQIYQQALPLNEYYSAHAYAFALTVIETYKTEKYLTELSKKEVSDSYSKKVQEHYIAGLSVRTPLQLTEDTEIQSKKRLQSKIEFWKINSIR